MGTITDDVDWSLLALVINVLQLNGARQETGENSCWTLIANSDKLFTATGEKIQFLSSKEISRNHSKDLCFSYDPETSEAIKKMTFGTSVH